MCLRFGSGKKLEVSFARVRARAKAAMLALQDGSRVWSDKNSEGPFPIRGCSWRSVVVMLCCEWSHPTQGEASMVGAVEKKCCPGK